MKPRRPPKISIIVPNYNGHAYLDECIRSVLSQGYPALELLVIDGGSTDESAAIVGGFGSAISIFVSEPVPVKRHSSGMQLRLGFGVAAHLEPDILVVDEALAVGDAAFQQKCLGKMRNVAENIRATREIRRP